VNLISSQSIELTKNLTLKYSIPFNFFVDHNGTIAEYLEISLKNGVPFGLVKKYGSDSLMPTLVVTNAQNTIVFTDQTNNYRVRPEPDVYLSILRRVRR
jgi:peroxiredoxin